MTLRYILFAGLSAAVLLILYELLFKENRVEQRLKAIEKNTVQEEHFDGRPGNKKEPRKLRFLHVPDAVRMALASADIKMREEEFVMLWIAITFIPGLLCFIISGRLVLPIVMVVVCAFIPPVVVSVKKQKRLAAFGNQLGDALMLLSNGLRAGFSFEQVLESVAKEMPDPISQEFGRVVREMKMGMTLEKSLTALTERSENTDMRLLTSAVLIQRQVGGNLADILDTISVTIQDRIRIKNNIKTITAQGRISGYVVGALPIGLFLIISVINREYMSMFYDTQIGRILLCVAAGMEVVGFLIIRKIIRIDA